MVFHHLSKREVRGGKERKKKGVATFKLCEVRTRHSSSCSTILVLILQDVCIYCIKRSLKVDSVKNQAPEKIEYLEFFYEVQIKIPQLYFHYRKGCLRITNRRAYLHEVRIRYFGPSCIHILLILSNLIYFDGF